MSQQHQPEGLPATGYATQFYDESNGENLMNFPPVPHGSKGAAIARAKDVTARREGFCTIYVDGVPYGGFRGGEPEGDEGAAAPEGE